MVVGVKINGALFAKEHHVPHNHISRWIKVKEIFTNWILKTKQIFEIIVKKYSFYYLSTKGAIFSKFLHSKTIFINVKICTYFILQNKYLRIYEDNFGAKILTDDCALTTTNHVDPFLGCSTTMPFYPPFPTVRMLQFY